MSFTSKYIISIDSYHMKPLNLSIKQKKIDFYLHNFFVQAHQTQKNHSHINMIKRQHENVELASIIKKLKKLIQKFFFTKNVSYCN